MGNEICGSDFRALYDLQNILSVADHVIDMVTHKSCVKRLYQLLCLAFFPECLPSEKHRS